MQSANDNASCEDTLIRLGTDAVFSKGMGRKLVVPELLKLHRMHADMLIQDTM